MTNKKEILYSRITRHGQNLKAMFNLDPNLDPVKLCKRLLRLETKAHKLAVDFCNGDIDQDGYDKKIDHLLNKVEDILANPKVPIFVNNDPRGYSLKISDEYIRNNNFNIHRDLGGYGIIAPDFREFSNINSKPFKFG